MIGSEPFGMLSDGTVVTLYKIQNNLGEWVELLDYGASIHAVCLKDKDGVLRDISLGVAKAEALEQFSHEGVTIGRVANRIAYGKCTIDGKAFELECNHRGHFLHGGSGNYAHKFFSASPAADGQEITFSLLDTGEGGFDCAARVSVTFRFDERRRLSIRYQMKAEGTTIFCPTNHVYFDLSGEGDVLNHCLRVNANRWTPKGDLRMPQGEIAPVDGTPMDYRESRVLGEALSQAAAERFFGGDPPQMDDTFLFDRTDGPVAELSYAGTGLAVQVQTDMPAMVAFTPFVHGPRPGKHGRYYAGYCGVALETQYVPNAINCPEYELPTFRAGEAFTSVTTYTFLTQNAQ